MSVNPYPVNDNKENYGQSYDELALWYISCLKNKSYKTAKEALLSMKQRDNTLAKDGEQ